MLSSESKELSTRDLVMLLAKHDREMLRYIMTFLPQRADAEEVLQRTAVVLWEKLAEFDTQRDFLAWALHRAYYEILNFRKEFARSKLVFAEDVVQQLSEERVEHASYLGEMKEGLQLCLKKLQPRNLELIQGRYFESKSIKEMAAEFGKTPKSLYRRLDRLRELIQACVEKQLKVNGNV